MSGNIVRLEGDVGARPRPTFREEFPRFVAANRSHTTGAGSLLAMYPEFVRRLADLARDDERWALIAKEYSTERANAVLGRGPNFIRNCVLDGMIESCAPEGRHARYQVEDLARLWNALEGASEIGVRRRPRVTDANRADLASERGFLSATAAASELGLAESEFGDLVERKKIRSPARFAGYFARQALTRYRSSIGAVTLVPLARKGVGDGEVVAYRLDNGAVCAVADGRWSYSPFFITLPDGEEVDLDSLVELPRTLIHSGSPYYPPSEVRAYSRRPAEFVGD